MRRERKREGRAREEGEEGRRRGWRHTIVKTRKDCRLV